MAMRPAGFAEALIAYSNYSPARTHLVIAAIAVIFAAMIGFCFA